MLRCKRVPLNLILGFLNQKKVAPVQVTRVERGDLEIHRPSKSHQLPAREAVLHVAVQPEAKVVFPAPDLQAPPEAKATSPRRTSSTGSQGGRAPRTSSTGSQGSLPRRTGSTGSKSGRPPRTSSTGSQGGRTPRTSSTGSETSIRGKNRKSDHEGAKKRTSMVSQNTRSKSKLPAAKGLLPKAAGASKNKREANQKNVEAMKETNRNSWVDGDVFVADTQGDVDLKKVGDLTRPDSPPKVKRWLSKDHPLVQLEKNSNTATSEIKQPIDSKNESLGKRNGKSSIERKSSSDSAKLTRLCIFDSSGAEANADAAGYSAT